MNIPTIDLPRVVILGGGFAGLKLAREINTSLFQIVLFDLNNYHTFQPLLYQVATAGLEPDSIAYPLRKTLKNKTHTHIRMAEIIAIHPENKKVETSIGSLSFNYLIIATGAVTNYFGMDNIARYSMPMKSLTESLNLRSLILQNFEKALNENDLEKKDSYMNFVIAGGGPTGVELAGALAELKRHVLPKDFPDLDLRRMQIHVIEAGEKLLGAMSQAASHNAKKYLRERGVNVWTSMAVKDYDGYTVKTSGQDFSTYSFIWTAGVRGNVPPGLPENCIEKGRILTDEFCFVNSFDSIIAIGDVAAFRSKEFPKGLPMLASVAQQQGSYVAKMLKRKIKGKKAVPFHYLDKGTMATVGRNQAVVDLGKLKFGGFIAWIIWLFVHLMLLVDFRNRVIVFVNWVWGYINFDKGTRLIVRKFERKEN